MDNMTFEQRLDAISVILFTTSQIQQRQAVSMTELTAGLVTLKDSVDAYIKDSRERMAQMERNLDDFIKAITAQRNN